MIVGGEEGGIGAGGRGVGLAGFGGELDQVLLFVGGDVRDKDKRCPGHDFLILGFTREADVGGGVAGERRRCRWGRLWHCPLPGPVFECGCPQPLWVLACSQAPLQDAFCDGDLSRS